MKYYLYNLMLFCLLSSLEAVGFVENTNQQNGSKGYSDLIALLQTFRSFQKVELIDGVPDYSPPAINSKRESISEFQQRLKTIDTIGWTIPEKIDYLLVNAEVKGMEFQYKVVKPWSRDPSFYLQTQAGSGPTRYGYIRLKGYPISEKEMPEFKVLLKAVPEVFDQAKKNLTEGAKDFALLAIQHYKEEVEYYQTIVDSVSKHHASMIKHAKRALRAVIDYGLWLEQEAPTMTGVAGVGKENYSWLMKNVYLFPYTWDQIRLIVELEDNRVRTFQRLEAHHNSEIPSLTPVQSSAEYKANVSEALDHIMNFLHDKELFTMHDYLVPDGYFGSWHEFDKPWPEKHDYFFNFSHREAVMEETHEMVGHHFDELRAARSDHPIRGGIPPYKIATARHEGFAFALEELLIYAGYLDGRSPHSKEIAYEQAAFRTVRALSDVYMHSQDWTLEEAVEYCVANAPHGGLLEDSHHLWYEMATTLRGVGHHMLMVLGKVQFMKLFRDRSNQLGDDFEIKTFLDEFYAKGSIPFSLIRWEMTGYQDEINWLLK